MTLAIHLGTALSADFLLICSAMLSICYLVQDKQLRQKRVLVGISSKMPAMRTLELAQSILLGVAFVLMSIGIVAGSFLAKAYWGEFWFLDPRQVWSLATWFLFAFVLFARLSVGWRGRRAMWVSLWGVFLVLAGIILLHYTQITKHGLELS